MTEETVKVKRKDLEQIVNKLTEALKIIRGEKE